MAAKPGHERRLDAAEAAPATAACRRRCRSTTSRSPSSAIPTRRSAWASRCAATCRPAPRFGCTIGVFDIFRYAQRTDPAHFQVIGELERRDLPGGIRMFHINGDEVEPVIARVRGARRQLRGRLQHHRAGLGAAAYPRAWAEHLRRFDEVWALSRFIAGEPGRGRDREPPVGQAVELEARADPAAALFRHPRIGLRAAELLRPLLLFQPQEPRRGAGAARPHPARRSVPRRAARAEGEERRARRRGMGGEHRPTTRR